MESQMQRLNVSFAGKNNLHISVESEKIRQFSSKDQNSPRSASLENRGLLKSVIKTPARGSYNEFRHFPQDVSRFAGIHRSQTLKDDMSGTLRTPEIIAPQSTDILRNDKTKSAIKGDSELMKNNLEEQIVVASLSKRVKTMSIHDKHFIANNFREAKLLNDDNIWRNRCFELNEEALATKAARHFKDAMLFQAPRDDLDRPRYPGVVAIYSLQISAVWNLILLLLSWLLLFMTFLEPTYASDADYVVSSGATYYPKLKGIEIAVVAMIWIDTLFGLYHMLHNNSKSVCNRLCSNKKMLVQILFGVCLLADLLAFHLYYPRVIFRFSRILRPVGIFLYSREVRRVAQALIHCIGRMMEILILFLVLSFVFALFACKLFGKQSDESTFEKQFQYDSLYEFFNAAFMLISAQSFPSIMYPSLQYTLYSLAYYLPYLAFSTLLLYPAPIGIFMKGYSRHREKTLIQDNLIQYEALITSFKTLTIKLADSNRLDSATFLKFMQYLYPDILEITFRNEVFEGLDTNQEGFLTWDEFLTVPKLISQSQTIPSLKWPRLKLWRKMRLLVATKLRLTTISHSSSYKSGLIITILANIGLNLYVLISLDDNLANGITQVQYVFLGIYVLDNVLNILQKGLAFHFSSISNILDAVLYLTFIWTPFSLSFLRIASLCTSLSNKKLVQFFDQNNAHKLPKSEDDRRAARNCASPLKGFLVFIRNVIARTLLLVQKLVLCSSIILKIVILLVLIIFLFSIIGIEIYNPTFQKAEVSIDPYINFNSFGFACLSLFQIITQQNWTDIYYVNIKNYTHSEVVSAVYFLSFYTLANIVVISLIRGMVCEVFLATDVECEDFNRAKTQNLKSLTGTKAFTGPSDIYGSKPSGFPEIDGFYQKSPKVFTTENNPISKSAQGDLPEAFSKVSIDRKNSKSRTFTPANPNVTVFATESKISKQPSEKSIKFSNYDESNRSFSQTQKIPKRQPNMDQSRSFDNSSISRDDSVIRELKGFVNKPKNLSYDDQSSGTYTVKMMEEDDLLDARDNKVQYLSSLYKVFRLKNEVPPKFTRNYKPGSRKTSDVTSEEFTFYADPLPQTSISYQERKAEAHLQQYLSPNQPSRHLLDGRTKDANHNQKQISHLSFPKSINSSNQMKSSYLRESAGFLQSFKDSDLQKPSSSLKVLSIQKGSAESNVTKILTLEFEIMTNERLFFLKCFKAVTPQSKVSMAYENADKLQLKLNELMNPSTAEIQLVIDRKPKNPKNPRKFEESFLKEKIVEKKRKLSKGSKLNNFFLKKFNRKPTQENFEQEIVTKKIVEKNGETSEIQNIESVYTKVHETSIESNFYNEKEKRQESKNSALLQVSRVLRFKSTSPRVYAKLLATVEKVINNKIISKKSFIKLIFSAADDKYFVFDTNRIKDEDVHLKSIKKGPWFYADELLPNEATIYKGKNLLTAREEKDQMAVDRLKEELELVLFKAQDKPIKLETLMRKDMYIIPFKNDDFFGVSQRLYQKFSHVKYVDKKRADSASIKDFFISVFYQRSYGKSQNNIDDPLNRSNNVSNGMKKSGFDFEENNQSLDDRNQSLEAEKIDEDKGLLTKNELIEFLMDLKSMFLPYKSIVFENISHLYFEKKAKAAGIEIERE